MDGNGKWDFEEIQQYLRFPSADVTVIVRMGKLDQGHERIEFQHDEELNSEVKNAIGSLNLDTIQMEVSAAPERGGKLEETLKLQFRSADIDKNGYIDKEESPGWATCGACLKCSMRTTMKSCSSMRPWKACCLWPGSFRSRFV